MINFHAIAVIVSLSTLSHLGVAAADPLPTENFKVLPLTLAVEAAEAAIASCKAQGYSVTAAIVDRAGNLKVLLVGEGANALTRELTPRKAYTAAVRRITTIEMAKAIATGFNSPFVSIPGSGFAQTFIGIDAVIVRFLARKAKKLAKKWGGQCIVFIDEIDAVGMRRQALGTGFNPTPTGSIWPAEDNATFYGQWGALNPSGDLIRRGRDAPAVARHGGPERLPGRRRQRDAGGDGLRRRCDGRVA